MTGEASLEWGWPAVWRQSLSACVPRELRDNTKYSILWELSSTAEPPPAWDMTAEKKDW